MGTFIGQVIGGLYFGAILFASTNPSDFDYPSLVTFLVVSIGAILGGQIAQAK